MTEGQSVTLSCLLFRGRRSLYSNFSFYKYDELLQSDVRGKLDISAVSKSDEGFYKCKHSGVSSPKSWMSVKCECDQHEVEQESPGWEVDSKLFYSVFSLRRLLNTRSTWSKNFFTYFYSFLHIYKEFLQLQNFFAHVKIYIFFNSKCLLNFWFCIFPRHGSAFAPHCSSSDPVNPAAPPSTSPVPLVIGLVGGITLILLLSLLLLCWCRNSKSESCSCSFHLNQTYSKLLSR